MASVQPGSVDGILASDLVIVVVGVTGSGKTTFISALLDEDVGIGHGLVSETAAVTAHLFTHPPSNKRVFLLDTPGFNDTRRDDAEVLRDLAFVLAQLYRRGVLVSGLVYCHDITRNRLEGSHAKMLRVFREVVGPAAYGHVVLLSTKWDKLGSGRSSESWTRAAAFEAELVGNDEFWGDLCRAGAPSTRWDGSRAGALGVVDHVEALQGRRGKTTLRIQSEIVDDGRELHETNAGRIVLGGLLDLERKFRAEMAELKAEFERAVKRKDGEHAAQLERQRTEMELRVGQMTQGQDKLLVSLTQLSEQKTDEYADKLERLQREIAQLEARMREAKSRPVQNNHQYQSFGGKAVGSNKGGDRRREPLAEEHSRLLKAQLALRLLGLLAGIGVIVAGGVTGNAGLLTTGLSIVGGSLTK